MTVIEFFNNNPIDDLVSCIALRPRRVIFIGDNREMNKCRSLYLRFVKELGTPTALEFRGANKHDLNGLVETLEDIVCRETDCAFDLTGGHETALAAMGIVYERYHNTRPISMHRFHVNRGTARDMVNNTSLVLPVKPGLTVSQTVMLYGGVIGGSTDGDELASWDFTPAFCEAIDRAWQICRTNPSHWNTQIARLCEFEKYRVLGHGALHMVIDTQIAAEQIDRYADKRDMVTALLGALDRAGLIHLSFCDDRIDYTYADGQIRRMLSKAGNLLELKVLHTAHEICEEDGSPFFGDCRQGVYIDWDGRFCGDDDATRFGSVNEIDVLLMHGLTPVFVSCKNGTVDDEELYKLSVVARRFGGPHAKKVLVATYVERNPLIRSYLVQRAHDMGICLIEGVHAMGDEEFAKKLKNSVL